MMAAEAFASMLIASGLNLKSISVYMGHADIESSFYYIHTSPEFLHAYAHLTAASQSLLPEVGFDET